MPFSIVDDIDRQLLIHLQREIPFRVRPFEAIGKKIGLDSADVILRINRLRDEAIIRQISAVFDFERIHYQNTFAAFQVAEETLEASAAVICRHPGVPLCSKRRGEFNLWFVLALPQQESLEDHGAQLQQLAQAKKAVFFKTLKVFKPAESGVHEKRDLSEAERVLMQFLQEDFPLTDEPFRKWAQRAGMTEEQLFKQVQVLQKEGLFKRIAVSTQFREKVSQNALVMWQIPEEKLESAGRAVASFPEVQNCMQRTASVEFPYSLHAVVEGISEELLKKIEQKIGLWPSQSFVKEKDYKKERLKYFSEEIQEWRNHFIESQKVRVYESA